MHSRIFTISENEINKNDNIFYKDDLFEKVEYADSIIEVKADKGWKEDVEWLSESMVGEIEIFPNVAKWTFTKKDKDDYFKNRFAEFVNYAKDISLETFEEPSFSWNIQNALEDKGGFHVALDEWGTYTMDEFMRKAQPGTTYYIGKTYDYHW